MWRPWRVRRRLTSTAAPAADGAGAGDEGTRGHQHAAGAGENVESSGKGHDKRRNRQEKLSRRTSKFLGIRKRDTVLFGVGTLILFPVLLVLVDVMKDRRISGELQWSKYYMRAVVDNEQNWQLGWRLEDLARQADAQRARMMVLLDTLHKAPPQRQGGGGGAFSISQAAKAAAAAWTGGDGKGFGGAGGEGGGEAEGDMSRAVSLSRVLAEDEDLNRIVSIQCAARPGVYVQVGMHAMVASADASCKVYSAATALHPHALFEKIELGEGRFALRAFSNRRFLRVTPPPPGEGDWTAWALEAGAPEVGLPEVFQMRDGMVYSEVMHGYLTCSGDGAEAEVKGYVGEYLWPSAESYQLVFKQVSNLEVEHARVLRDVSRAVNKEQRRVADAYIASQAALEKREAGPPAGEKVETIAVCIPMTSRGTLMNTTYDSPVWTHAFGTFLSSTDWRAPKFRFHWYFGFDAGDAIYDGPVAAKHLGKEFVASAVEEFARQGLTKIGARRLMEDKVLLLKTKSYRGMQHAPSHVVSALMQDAYDDGCDYFYQINDDTLINTGGWAEVFTRELRNNPLGRNVGVTGPTDTNNRRILTHAFVHRTHIDVFGRFFPVSFRNWWSDDWISNVYGREHTLRDHSVTITHDVRSQKSSEANRYLIDYSAQLGLRDELQTGHVTLSKWLKANDMPPPLLPMVCGYAPLASDILKALKGGWGDEKPPPPKPPTMMAGGNNERTGAAGPALEDEAAVEVPTPSKGSNSKMVSAGAGRAARDPETIDDADSPGR